MRHGCFYRIFFILLSFKLDEDIHQCGRCKEIFHDVTAYLKHKSTKACKTGKSKSSAEHTPVKQQPPPSQQQQQQAQQQHQSIGSTDGQPSGSIDNLQQQQQPQQASSNQNQEDASETTSAAANQNILEAAAKNTIFRDSFISMANQPAESLEKPPVNEEGVGYNTEFWSKDKEQSDVILSPPDDLVESGKKSMIF